MRRDKGQSLPHPQRLGLLCLDDLSHFHLQSRIKGLAQESGVGMEPDTPHGSRTQWIVFKLHVLSPGNKAKPLLQRRPLLGKINLTAYFVIPLDNKLRWDEVTQ